MAAYKVRLDGMYTSIEYRPNAEADEGIDVYPTLKEAKEVAIRWLTGAMDEYAYCRRHIRQLSMKTVESVEQF